MKTQSSFDAQSTVYYYCKFTKSGSDVAVEQNNDFVNKEYLFLFSVGVYTNFNSTPSWGSEGNRGIPMESSPGILMVWDSQAG